MAHLTPWIPVILLALNILRDELKARNNRTKH